MHFSGGIAGKSPQAEQFRDSVVEALDQIDPLRFLITLQETRSYQPNLKSGYYHVVRKANVPIVIAGPNFAEKTFTIMSSRMALATLAKAQVIEFCKTQHAYYPENTLQ